MKTKEKLPLHCSLLRIKVSKFRLQRHLIQVNTSNFLHYVIFIKIVVILGSNKANCWSFLCEASHLLPFPFGLGDVPRLRCSTGERFGERFIKIELPFSFSGDGDEPPPVAEFLRDGVRRIVASKCLNLNEK